MSHNAKEVEDILKRFSPDEKAFAETLARLRIEHRAQQQQLAELRRVYDEMWIFFISLLKKQENHELRLSQEDFLQFRHEYRIDSTIDDATGDRVYKLLTLTDE